MKLSELRRLFDWLITLAGPRPGACVSADAKVGTRELLTLVPRLSIDVEHLIVTGLVPGDEPGRIHRVLFGETMILGDVPLAPFDSAGFMNPTINRRITAGVHVSVEYTSSRPLTFTFTGRRARWQL